MTSKWFRGASNLSDDEEEEEQEEQEEEQEEEEEEEEEVEQSQQQVEDKRSKWLKTSSSREEEEKAAASGSTLSKKAREESSMFKHINLIKNSFKVQDYSKTVEHLEGLEKTVAKVQGPLGGEPNTLPKAMVKVVIAIENNLARTAENVKNLNKTQAKSCNTLKHKVKKIHKANETQVDAMKAKWDFDDPEKSDDEEDDDQEEEDDQQQAEVNLEDKDKNDWTPEAVHRKIEDILAQRGKKLTDKQTQVEAFKKILQHVKEEDVRVEVFVHLTSAWFDTGGSLLTHLPQTSWKNAYECLSKVFNILANHPNLALQEIDALTTEADRREAKEKPEQPTPLEGVTDQKKIPIAGNMVSFIERLDDEYIRSLQFTDAHTQDYITRFQDEAYLLDIMERVYNYYIVHEMTKHASRVAIRLIEHLYYRREEDHIQMLAKQRNMCEKTKKKKEKEEREAAEKAAEDGEPSTPVTEPTSNIKRRKEYTITSDLHDTVSKYMTLVLKHGDEKGRKKALLCNMYRLALHNNFSQARDLLLMSRYTEQTFSTASFQILYNRVLAQLGLAAFRVGCFKDANLCLNELCATQKLRELLAQGTTQRFMEKKPEQEKQDKMKLLPFHMHINLDLLESVHLVSALLLEVPIMVAAPFDKRKTSSKAFAKLLTLYSHQVFLGPPETTRDNVYAAKCALEVGNWKKCCAHVIGLPTWEFLPNSDGIRTMLTRRIKEEALRCYLFKYSQFYDTLSLESLANQFELTQNKIHSVVSKMIFNDELSGSWDQPASCIRIHHTHPTKLQYLISRAADKSQQLLDSNERILEPRNSGFGSNLGGKGYGGKDWAWGGMDGGRFSGLGNVKRNPVGFTRNFGGSSSSWFTKGNKYGYGGSSLSGQRKQGPMRFR